MEKIFFDTTSYVSDDESSIIFNGADFIFELNDEKFRIKNFFFPVYKKKSGGYFSKKYYGVNFFNESNNNTINSGITNYLFKDFSTITKNNLDIFNKIIKKENFIINKKEYNTTTKDLSNFFNVNSNDLGISSNISESAYISNLETSNLETSNSSLIGNDFCVTPNKPTTKNAESDKSDKSYLYNNEEEDINDQIIYDSTPIKKKESSDKKRKKESSESSDDDKKKKEKKKRKEKKEKEKEKKKKKKKKKEKKKKIKKKKNKKKK
jgi:hypothetical protein